MLSPSRPCIIVAELYVTVLRDNTITLSCPRYNVSESGSVQYTLARSRGQHIVMERWTKHVIITIPLQYLEVNIVSTYPCHAPEDKVKISYFVHCSITICWPRDRVKVYCADPDSLTVYPAQLIVIVLSHSTVTHNFTTIMHGRDGLNILCDFCHPFLSLSCCKKGGLLSDN